MYNTMKNNKDNWGWFNGKDYCEITCPTTGEDIATNINKENALLICTAVNACKAINPANPLKVAEVLPDIFKLLQELYDNSEPLTKGYIGSENELKIFRILKSALSTE